MSKAYMRVAAVGMAGLWVAASGCASSSESASRQTMSEHVGKYDAPPSGIDHPRTGVPPFESTGHGSSKELNDIAADQLTTLAVNSERFDVIERAQLGQLLKEQGLEGIVKPDELAQSGKVRGVDYLLVGKVSNLRVKAEKTNRGFGFGDVRLPGGGGIGGFDFKRKDSTITAECGVDIRLVEATSGKVAAAQHSDYKRTDSIGAFGVEILGANAEADADLKLDEDNKGLILRLALDDALRQMLPKVDKALLARAKVLKASAPAQAVAPTEAPPQEPPKVDQPKSDNAKKFCSGCGAQVAAGVKFCAGCGTKIE